MLLLISPSKTQDFTPEPRNLAVSQPALLSESEALIAKLRTLSEAKLAKLMDISPKLAALNHQRFADFSLPFTPRNAKPAVLAFRGDVYDGLDAASLTDAQLQSAQHSLRILSGLYGVLKPLDLIQPYRLEMGTTLATKRGKNLYAFWGSRITDMLNAHLAETGASTVVNLASNEYFSAVKPKALNGRLITVHFKEDSGGSLKVIGLFAKRARGMMARHIITTTANNPDEIQGFAEDGYRFHPTLSTDTDFVFARKSKKA